MNDFDPQNVFNRRMLVPTANLESIKADDFFGVSKTEELEEASRLAAESLARASAEKQANMRSWTSSLGLDTDSTAGQAVNKLASYVDGFNKYLVTGVGTALPALETIISNSAIPNSVREAKSRMDAGKASAQDMSLLAQPAYENPQADPESGGNYATPQGRVPTYLEQLQGIEQRSNNVDMMRKFMDTGYIVNRTNQNELNRDTAVETKEGVDQMKEGWKAFRDSGNNLLEGTGDMVVGLGKTLAKLPKLAYNNPEAVLEHVVTNVPQLAAAMMGMGPMLATNMGYATSSLQDGVEAYKKANNGDMPSSEWMAENSLKALSLMVAETVGDKFVASGAKAFGAVADPLVDAAQAGVAGMSRGAFKTALGIGSGVVAPVAKVAGATVKGALGEFGTETYQTAAEMEIKGETPTLEDAVQGGVIGALSGGAISGGLAVGSAAAETVASAARSALERRGILPPGGADIPGVTREESKAAYDAAVASGDVGVFTNRESPQFSPTKALEALSARTNQDTVTPEERNETVLKSREIVSKLESDQEILRQSLELGKGMDEAGIAEVQTTLGVLNKLLENTPPEETARVQKLTNAIAGLGLQIKAADPKQISSLEAGLHKGNRELSTANKVMSAMAISAASKPVEGESPTAKANRVINLSMASVDSMTQEEADAMRADASLGLSPKQRDYLRQFSEARIAENKAKNIDKVTETILFGKDRVDQSERKRDFGIADYRKMIAQAVATGNMNDASRYVDMLEEFTGNHQQKADLAEELMQASRDEDRAFQMVFDEQEQKWYVHDGDTPLSQEEMDKNGGLEISHRRSGKLVSNIGVGAAALQAAYAEQAALYDLAFDGVEATPPQSPLAAAQAVIAEVSGTSAPVTPPAVTPVPEVSVTGQAAVDPSKIMPSNMATGAAGSVGSQTTSVADPGFDASNTTGVTAQPKAASEVSQKTTWARNAKKEGSYEVSSKGDVRFSALNAKLADGRTIEEAYQLDVKGYRDPSKSKQSWTDGKGRPPKNNLTKKQSWEAYKALWQQWASENPALMAELKKASVGKTLTDMFATTDISQARALSEILNEQDTPASTTPAESVAPTKPAAVKKKLPSDPYEGVNGKLITADGDTYFADEKEATEAADKKDGYKAHKARGGWVIEPVSKKQQKQDAAWDKQKKLDAETAATEAETTLTATAADYAEAVRVSESTNEDDMESTPSRILKLVTALAQGEKINVLPETGNQSADLQNKANQTDDKAMEYLKWLENPKDYTTDKVKETVTWAKGRQEKLAEMSKLAAKDDNDLNEAISSAKSALKYVLDKAALVLEGDASLAEFEGTAEPVTPPPANTPTPDSETPPAEGEYKGLRVFLKKTAEGTKNVSFKTRNLIADFFTQSAGSDKSASRRPLVLVQDFLSQWPNTQQAAKGYFQQFLDKPLTNDQMKALSLFKKKAQYWNTLYQQDLAQKIAEDGTLFGYKDLFQFLVESTAAPNGKSKLLDLEENFKTAMSLVAFNYVNSQSGASLFNDSETMLKLLNLKKHEELPPGAYQHLRRGQLRNMVQNSMGAEVLKVLGIKQNSDSPAELRAKLESSIGAHITRMLEKKNIVQVHGVPPELMGNAKNVEMSLIFLARNDVEINRNKNKPRKEHVKESLSKYVEDLVTEIKEATKGTGGVIEALFGVEPAIEMPSFTPIDFLQKVSKNRTKVPKFLREVLNRWSNTENFLNEGNYQMFGTLSPETQEMIAGYEILTEDNTHIDEVRGKETNNDAIRKNVQALNDFAFDVLNHESGLGYKQPFFFNGSMWNQQRTSTTGAINMQTIKVHRHMMGRKSWNTDITVDSTLDQLFMVRAAEAFGFKFERTHSDKLLEKAMEKINQPEIQAAIEVVKNHMGSNEPMSEENQEILLKGVQKGGANTHSYSAIVALATRQKAMEAKVELNPDGTKNTDPAVFVSGLMSEIDGVTNGPMLTQLLLGLGDFNVLNKGGFFEKALNGPQLKKFNDWRGTSGSQDFYEYVAQAVVDRIRESIVGVSGEYLKNYNALEYFTGEIFNSKGELGASARDFVKKPVTALNFGSGKRAVIEGMGGVLVDDVYKKITAMSMKMSNDERADPENSETAELIKSINDLMNGQSIDSHIKSMADLMNYSFSTSNKQAMKDTFANYMGNPVWEAMEEVFGDLIDTRNRLNEVNNLSFDIYHAAYNAEVAKIMEKRMQEGTLAMSNEVVNKKTGRVTPPRLIEGLTVAEEAQIRKTLKNLEPLVETAMSKVSKDKEAGIKIGKFKKKLSGPDEMFGLYRGESSFPASPGSRNKYDTTRTSGEIIVEQGPGVGVLPIFIHSLDSYISHLAGKVSDILNIHDAHGVGMSDYVEAGKRLNKAVWEAALIFSPAASSRDTLYNTLVQAANYLEKAELSSEQLGAFSANLMDAVNGLSDDGRQPKKEGEILNLSDGLLFHIADVASRTAVRTDTNKLMKMKRMAYIDQYPNGEGSYEVTKEDLADVDIALAEVNKNEGVPADVRNAINRIHKKLGLESADIALEESSAGKMGTPHVPADPKVEALVKKHSGKPVKELINDLYKLVDDSKGGTTKKFNRALLYALKTAVPAKTTVNYVTADSPKGSFVPAQGGPSRGWFITTVDGQAVINILSSEHVDSGLNTELLIHELLHASLAQVIANVKNGTNKDPVAIAMVKELEAILVATRGFLKKQGNEELKAKYENATADVDELLSWGMTNAGFQDEVLVIVKVPRAVSLTQMIDGAKALYTALSEFIFRASDKKLRAPQQEGLQRLIRTTSLLLAYQQQALAESEGTASPEVNLSMAAVIQQSVAAMMSAKGIMHALGFKSAPKMFASLSEKLLTNPDIDPDSFMAESAESLSHALMEGQSGKDIRAMLDHDMWLEERTKIKDSLVSKGMMRGDAWVQAYRVIVKMALESELAARSLKEKKFIEKIKELAGRFLERFKRVANSKEFVQLVSTKLNAVIEAGMEPPVLKAGFKKVTFQEAVTADPMAANVLTYFSKNKMFVLTGSIVLATTGSIYRNAKNMLHDLDFVVTGTKEEAEAYMRKEFPDAVQIYDFKTGKTAKTDSFIIPPPGAKITNVVKENGKVTSFIVEKDGTEIGRTWNDESGEQKSGTTGTIVDFFTGGDQKAVATVAYTHNGKNENIQVVGAGTIFDAKLTFGREKDLKDYRLYTPNMGKSLGESAGSVINLSMAANTDPGAAAFSTSEVFEALDQAYPSTVSAEFKEDLADLLNRIVRKLHGPFGVFKDSMQKDRAIHAEDVLTKAIESGEAPFVSSAQQSGFKISEQEGFVMEQVEATVRQALENNEDGNAAYAARGLRKLYIEARENLVPQDLYDGVWEDAHPLEQQKTQELYDFLFKVESVDQISDYLSRFAALGLAVEQVNKVLKKKTLDKKKDRSKPTSLSDRLIRWFNNVLDFTQDKFNKTYRGQPADSKLNTLVRQLVDIEAKRVKVANRTQPTLADKMESAGDTANQWLFDKIKNFSGSSFVYKSKNETFKAGVNVVRFVAQGRADELLFQMGEVRNKMIEGRLGAVMSTLKDALGAPALFQALLRSTKNLERMRKHVASETSKLVKDGFVNKGKDITEQHSKALTNVVMRSGMFVLLDDFTEQEIADVLKSRTELKKAIAVWEQKLSGFPEDIQKYYRNQSKSLGYFMAWNIATGPNMMMNASNIAELLDTGREGELSSAQVDEATKVIDVLASLHALNYHSVNDMKAVTALMDKEFARTDEGGNGIISLMYTQKMLDKEARETLFSNNTTMMVKGYTSEILNPYTDIQAEYDDAVDEKGNNAGDMLVNAGYTRGPVLPKDPADPDSIPRRLYTRKGGGLTKFQTAIMGYTSTSGKGSSVDNGNFSDTSADGSINISNRKGMVERKQAELVDMFNQDFDPTMDEKPRAVALFNPNGDVAGYRYMMARTTKDDLLQRTNDFSMVMGAMAGSTFDKQTVNEQNIRVVEEHKNLYDLEYRKTPEAFIEFGPHSPDKEVRELYRLLPYETRKAIKEAWGKPTMYIRNDLFDLTFGYRKYSLANIWDKDQKNMMELAFVWFAENAIETAARLSLKSPEEARRRVKRAQFIVQKSERVWMDIVTEVKDIIVVKTVVVMVGNVVSNLSLLKMAGVSFTDMAKHHMTATIAIKTWERDSSELFKLQTELQTGYSNQNKATIVAKIKLLEDNLQKNPVRGLIEAGLKPTIVEDLGTDDSPYTYKAQLAGYVKDKTANWNPAVLGAANQAYMTKDTLSYRTLSEITQLSDFVARYTLYKHLTTKNNPLSHEEAIQKASDYFVNYDAPMHKTMTYLDDAGLMMFTKYFIRIQRVLLDLIKNNPTRVLGFIALDAYTDIPNLILDSSVISNFGDNPMGIGAAGYFSTLGSLGTVQAVGGLIKPF